jgi:hypothetical protein
VVSQEILGDNQELAWHFLYLEEWMENLSINSWWSMITRKPSHHGKVLASITLLVSWIT